MSCCRKFGALLKKNLILRKRHYIITALELIIPILLVLPLLYMHSPLNVRPIDSSYDSLPSIIFPTVNIEDILDQLYFDKDDKFLFAPNDNTTSKFMEDIKKELKSFDRSSKQMNFVGFENEEKIKDYLIIQQLNDFENGSVVGGAIINRNKEDIFDYKLWIKNVYYSGGADTALFRTGLIRYAGRNRFAIDSALIFQHVLDRMYMKKYLSKTGTQLLDSINFYVQSFPAPPENLKNYQSAAIIFFSTIIISLSFTFFIASLIGRVIQEKSSRMKEFLKLTGMSTVMHWGSWFLNGFLLMFFVCLVMVGIISINVEGYESIIHDSNKFLVFILFAFYSISTVLFCFTISVFFPRAIFGCMVGIMAWLASCIVPVIIFTNLISGGIVLSPLSKRSLCLIPNFGLFWGLNIIINLEFIGGGLQLDTMATDIDLLNMSEILLVMFLSWFLYAFMIWYFEAVWPWQMGVPRPLYFPFLKSYWCGIKPKTTLCNSDSQEINKEYFEMDNVDRYAGINIKCLSKVFQGFKEDKVAVDNLSLKLYKGEITALLGHNGAGKTTTISIISGMITPSSGTVLVNGFDICSNLTEARSNMGFCPQESIFFNELTVKEHLELIVKLKGYRTENLEEDITNVCRTVELEQKLNALASTLSGGMKRKLALAMAMVGDSQVLLLDEPTSGLDPEARRKIWDMLLSLRLEKTILLTTHYMEEADALGDRIAIMTHGKVFCCGSAIFLKNSFDAGYHLRMIKKDGCNVEKLVNQINKYIPVKVERDFGQELSLLIETSDLSQYPTTFEMLEKNKDELGVENFGLSVTNMEDVFLRVGSLVETEKKDKTAENVTTEPNDTQVNVATNLKTYKNITGVHLILVQLFGLFLKRFHYNRRQLSSLIVQIVVPMLIFLGAYMSDRAINSSSHEYKSQDLTLSLYGSTNVLYNLKGDIADNYVNIIDKLSSSKLESNVTDQLLKVGISDPYSYTRRHIIAADVKNNSNQNLVALYNPLATYAAPISMNLIHNALSKTYNLPGVIRTSMQYFDVSMSYDIYGTAGYIYGCITPLAFAFLSTFCIIFIIRERTCKSKHLQIMTALNTVTFWVGHFIYDFIFCLFAFVPIVIIMAVDTHGFGRSSLVFGSIILAIVLFLCAALPFTYVLSFAINRPAVGFTIIAIFQTVSTIIVLLVRLITFDLLKDHPFKAGVDKAERVFRLIPVYPFTKIIAVTKLQVQKTAQCDEHRSKCSFIKNTTIYYSYCCKDYSEYNPLMDNDLDGCKTEYIMLIVASLVYFTLLVVIELPVIKKTILFLYDSIRLRKSLRILGQTDRFVNEDEDVTNHRSLINDQMHKDSPSNYALVVHELTKQYPKILAVDNLSFGVPKDQCFGLLGVNGAGKTTSFSMLTGDTRITKGNAIIEDISLRKQKTRFQEKIGYCPQFDAHLDMLTGTELLHLFARLRGVPSGDIKEAVMSLIQMVNLQEHAPNKSSTYSGGNKRKLSIAVSMIGFPQLIFLDEPTAGIDPFARRQIWNLITSIKASGIAVILTSHSMEECEALCDSLSIMVDGKIKCFGSITYLKNKFGQGFTIEAKQKFTQPQDNGPKMKTIKEKIESKIPSSKLTEEHQGTITYHVLDVNESWSHMFQVMEDLKREDLLENYSITATTLEQVFLSFAKLKNN